MTPDFNESKTTFSVMSIDSGKNLVNLHETLKDAIKELADEGIPPSELLDWEKYSFYIARESRILRVSSATLCRAMAAMFREEGIGCDI
jgi:hypothetical protein